MPMEISANIKDRQVAMADSLPRQDSSSVSKADPATMRQKLPLAISGDKKQFEENQPEIKQSEPIEKTVEELNLHVQSLKRDLYFSIDADSGDTIIRVVDTETKEIIRTIPSEDISDIGQRFSQSVGLLLSTSI